MFFAIPNLSASTVRPVEKPWELSAAASAPHDKSKAEVIKWGQSNAVEHTFLSAYEGVSPGVRVSKSAENPPFRMHGLIVDYDAKVPENAVEYLMEKPPSEFAPQWFVRTTSDNGRLIWAFERPLLFTSHAHFKPFLVKLSKALRLPNWLAQLDAPALADPSRYYELGMKWEPVRPDKCIPMSHLQLWMFDTAKDLKFDNTRITSQTVPLKDVEAAVHERFPGRWQGYFDVGSRGVRFWDPGADNPTAAVVLPEGMMCFTGNKAFMSWGDIFGRSFTEQYEASAIAQVTEHTAYDGKEFWMLDDGMYKSVGKDDFTQYLRCSGYSGSKAKGATCSEIDLIENTIKVKRKVYKAMPFLYHPHGIIRYNGKTWLNTSDAVCTQPGAPFENCHLFSSGRRAFPTIYGILRSMFGKVGEDMESDDGGMNTEALVALLAWVKHFYVPSLNHKPQPGHAIVIAGHAGKGKTLFVDRILGGLMGCQSEDASEYMLNGEQWTERLVESAILCIDDNAVSGSSQAKAQQWTEKLKKYIATSRLVYNAKYKCTDTVPHFGRLVILCNLDPQSLKVLPSMDIGTSDKISLFQASPAQFKYDAREQLEAAIAKDIPNFARFLVEWDIPDKLRGGASSKRFGIDPYHDVELVEESRQQEHGTVIELLYSFLQSYRDHNPTKKWWEGTTVQLHTDLAGYMPEVAKEIKLASLSTKIGKLASRGDLNHLKYIEAKTKVRMWRFGFDLFGKATDEMLTPPSALDRIQGSEKL